MLANDEFNGAKIFRTYLKMSKHVHTSSKTRSKYSSTSVNYAFSLVFASSELRLVNFEIGSSVIVLCVTSPIIRCDIVVIS